MTRSETIAVIELLRRAYPRFIEPSPWEPDAKRVISGVVDLWSDMFSTDTPQLVAAAVRKHISASKFPPTIADIRALLTDMTAPSVSPGEIWQEAHRLLNSGIPADQPEAAYSRMSPACKAATLSIGGWYALSMSEEGDPHIGRAFLQAATAYTARERDSAALPAQAALAGGVADG